MADVNISKYRASVVRDGSKPASPGFVVSEGQDPVNPPGTNNFVPYTGATANVELGEFGVEAGFVTLDTTPTNIPTDQGAIYWDDTRSTAALIMNGTLQHIGQDSFFYVKNSSGSTIPKGTCVGFAGTDGGSGHLLITPFLANGSVPSTYFMGVTAEAIANGSFGQVMHFGELEGINTSGFTAGALLYASSTVAGAFQTTPPVAPNNIILVAAAVNSKNNGAIVVRPTLGSNFNTNESVKLTSVANLDLLQYQSGTGVWENKTLAQVIGSAYVPSTRTLTINGVTQDLSANRTYNVGTVTSVGLSSATSGVTIGSTPVTSSGTITLAIATASGSQQGLLSAADWTTFNNKQNALTNPVTGTGTTNYLPKFTGSTTIGNSQVFDNGTNVGINTNSPGQKFTIVGSNTLQSLSVGTDITHQILIGADSSYAEIQGITQGVAYNKNLILQRQGANVLIGTTSDTGQRLQVNGDIRINNGAADGGQLVLASSGFSDWNIDNFSGSLRAYYGSTEYLRLTSGGNLLIGTTTDNGNRLQVSGSATFSGNLILTNGVNRIIRIGSSTNYYYDLQTTGDDFQIIEAGSTPRLTIKYPNGNVGINTTTPATTLEVNGVGLFSGGSLVGNTKNGVYIYDQAIISLAGTNPRDLQIQAQNLRFFTGTTYGEKLRIFTDGNVLIQDGGTFTNNGARLQVSGNARFTRANDSGSILRLESVGGAGFDFSRSQTTGALSIQGSQTGFNNIVLAPTSGNVLIGTTTDGGSNQPLQVVKAGSSNYLRLQADNNASYDCAHFFTDGTNSVYAGMMRATSGLTGAYSIFTGGVVSLNVTSSGFLKASNTGTYVSSTGSYHELINSATGNNIAYLWNTSANPYGPYMRFSAAAPNNGTNYYLYFDDTSAVRFRVNSNGGISNYQANDVNLSDERTKKEISPLESYWDKFKAIEIVKFKYKDQTHDDFNIGVIAQQVEKVAPEFVDVDGWDNKTEGNEVVSQEEPIKSIYTADLHHATIKVLQEAMAKIEAMQKEIDTLKN